MTEKPGKDTMTSMRVFFVDGSQRHFADIILENLVTGRTCSVASYGFGVKQVDRLIGAFDQFLLVADTSHAQLNTKAYNNVVKKSDTLDHFTFNPINTHAKLALIDDEVIIFTSANLSANRRMESYMVGTFDEVEGIEQLQATMGSPGDIFKKPFDPGDIDLGELSTPDIDLDDLTIGDSLEEL